MREAARKAGVSRRYAENVHKKIILPLKTILTGSEIRSVAQELLRREDISPLLQRLLEKAVEKTDEPGSRTIFETVLLFLDKDWVTPEIIMTYLSFMNKEDLTPQTIKILPVLFEEPISIKKISFYLDIISKTDLEEAIFMVQKYYKLDSFTQKFLLFLIQNPLALQKIDFKINKMAQVPH
ncbi:MAG: hypothetical protein IBX72_13680 [Nitrospirae bacterium]|nr:hypothetical protein [Nitrospirota bacterium]